MENNKKTKNEENKNSSYRQQLMLFSCVVAQNIKQHSEEFEVKEEALSVAAEAFLSRVLFLFVRDFH